MVSERGRAGRTGGWGGRWVDLERPKPARVGDVEDFWMARPPVLSDRCTYWVRQILRGWRPPRRVAMEGYHGATEWYGVYLWEYLHVLSPLLDVLGVSQYATTGSNGKPWTDDTGLAWQRVEAGGHADLVCRWTGTVEWPFAMVVQEVGFADKVGGPVVWWWPVDPQPLMRGGDVFELSLPVETVLVKVPSRWPIPFGVSLAEACGEPGLPGREFGQG